MSRFAVPITDQKDRVIAVLAGSPNDHGWPAVHQSAAEALESNREKLNNPTESELKHRTRRGDFPQEAVGESMGGGQTVLYFIF